MDLSIVQNSKHLKKHNVSKTRSVADTLYFLVTYLEFWTMDTVLKRSDSEHYTPSSEPFRIPLYAWILGTNLLLPALVHSLHQSVLPKCWHLSLKLHCTVSQESHSLSADEHHGPRVVSGPHIQHLKQHKSRNERLMNRVVKPLISGNWETHIGFTLQTWDKD
jgi:hypothetical protein